MARMFDPQLLFRLQVLDGRHFCPCLLTDSKVREDTQKIRCFLVAGPPRGGGMVLNPLSYLKKTK